jgi:hypothetical protein
MDCQEIFLKILHFSHVVIFDSDRLIDKAAPDPRTSDLKKTGL